jgi:uncharacterized Zn finger protein
VKNQCAKCNGEDFAIYRHYQYHDIYECIHCGHWFQRNSEDCCRAPYNVIVVEHYGFDKSRVFHQCANCGYANRAKCLNSKKFDEQIDASFDEYKFEERKQKKQKELDFIQQQYQYYKNSIYFKYCNYLNSREWKKKREVVLRRDNYKCQHCNVNPAENVHHLSYKNIYEEPLEDLISVCKECHLLIHQSMFVFDKNEAVKI